MGRGYSLLMHSHVLRNVTQVRARSRKPKQVLLKHSRHKYTHVIITAESRKEQILHS